MAGIKSVYRIRKSPDDAELLKSLSESKTVTFTVTNLKNETFDKEVVIELLSKKTIYNNDRCITGILFDEKTDERGTFWIGLNSGIGIIQPEPEGWTYVGLRPEAILMLLSVKN